jgi:hypothetical protein
MEPNKCTHWKKLWKYLFKCFLRFFKIRWVQEIKEWQFLMVPPKETLTQPLSFLFPCLHQRANLHFLFLGPTTPSRFLPPFLLLLPLSNNRPKYLYLFLNHSPLVGWLHTTMDHYGNHSGNFSWIWEKNCI